MWRLRYIILFTEVAVKLFTVVSSSLTTASKSAFGKSWRVFQNPKLTLSKTYWAPPPSSSTLQVNVGHKTQSKLVWNIKPKSAPRVPLHLRTGIITTDDPLIRHRPQYSWQISTSTTECWQSSEIRLFCISFEIGISLRPVPCLHNHSGEIVNQTHASAGEPICINSRWNEIDQWCTSKAIQLGFNSHATFPGSRIDCAELQLSTAQLPLWCQNFTVFGLWILILVPDSKHVFIQQVKKVVAECASWSMYNLHLPSSHQSTGLIAMTSFDTYYSASWFRAKKIYHEIRNCSQSTNEDDSLHIFRDGRNTRF